jgi:hypothetical protein
MYANTPAGQGEVMAANNQMDVMPVLGSVGASVLLLHCTGDPAVRVGRSRRWPLLSPTHRSSNSTPTSTTPTSPKTMSCWPSSSGTAVQRRGSVSRLGPGVLIGLHTGRLERRGDEIWVTDLVPGLVAGSSHRFHPEGPHPLKGLPAPIELHSLNGPMSGA